MRTGTALAGWNCDQARDYAIYVWVADILVVIEHHPHVVPYLVVSVAWHLAPSQLCLVLVGQNADTFFTSTMTQKVYSLSVRSTQSRTDVIE